MRQLVRIACGVLLIAATGVVGWMANAISRGNIDAFRNWNSLYDCIAIVGLVGSCVLLGAIAVMSRSGVRLALVLMGVSLLAIGVVGHYGFKYLSLATLAPINHVTQRKPNAAETVLGFHYVCPTLGGYVAFGDGSVRYVDREYFATLRHADTPDQPPEFISPVKEPPEESPRENADERRGESSLQMALIGVQEAQERMTHSNNLKRMVVDHFGFRRRDGIRVPLKPEHFNTYPGMTDELRKAILDGTYVWYFGWEPTISYATERTRALWYDFASWASVYIVGFGIGSLLAGLILVMKRSNPTLAAGSEPA